MKKVIEFLTEQAQAIQQQIVAEKRKAMQYIQDFQPGQPPMSQEALQRLSGHLGSVSLLLQVAKQKEQVAIQEAEKPKKPTKPLKTIKPKKIKKV